MKQIKKLSTKLLLALGVIILSVIVWQVIVSKQVIGDEKKIKQAQSIEQIQELLKNGDLKTYRMLPCSPFSTIKLNEARAYILKGDEYAIYMSQYDNRNVEVVQNEDELFLNKKTTFSVGLIFIFMPEDPQFVYFTKPKKESWAYSKQIIYGFRGENTLLSFEEGGWQIVTNMPYINVNQRNSYLQLHTFSQDSTARMNHVQINVNAENSQFSFNDPVSNRADVNIQLQESDIRELKINSESTIGTLRLKGTLHKENKFYEGNGKMDIKHPGQCDSLIIQLTSNPGVAKQLFLSKELSGKFENIDCSKNVIITRGE